MQTQSLRQAAILLLTLGPQTAGEILKHLPEELVERLVAEVRGLRHVGTRERRDALAQLQDFAQDAALAGGDRTAKHMLERALGPHRAGKMWHRMADTERASRWPALQRAEPVSAARVLQRESPQTVALALAQIDPRRAGPILQHLPSSLRAEVAYRMATLQSPAPEFVDLVEDALAACLGNPSTRGDDRRAGPRRVAELLNHVEPSVWGDILEQLRDIHEDTAQAVKNLMFVFEDLVTLEDRYVQDLLKEIDTRELTYALKATTDEVREKIFRNMSKRASAGIQEDMEYLGPIRLAEALEAQQRIVDTLRRLERDGVVALSGSSPTHDTLI